MIVLTKLKIKLQTIQITIKSIKWVTTHFKEDQSRNQIQQGLKIYSDYQNFIKKITKHKELVYCHPKKASREKSIAKSCQCHIQIIKI
jgi:hypothetical protein